LLVWGVTGIVFCSAYPHVWETSSGCDSQLPHPERAARMKGIARMEEGLNLSFDFLEGLSATY